MTCLLATLPPEVKQVILKRELRACTGHQNGSEPIAGHEPMNSLVRGSETPRAPPRAMPYRWPESSSSAFLVIPASCANTRAHPGRTRGHTAAAIRSGQTCTCESDNHDVWYLNEFLASASVDDSGGTL